MNRAAILMQFHCLHLMVPELFAVHCCLKVNTVTVCIATGERISFCASPSACTPYITSITTV